VSRENFPLTSRKSFGKFSEQEFCREILGMLKRRGLTVTEYISKERFGGFFAACLFFCSHSQQKQNGKRNILGGGEGGKDG
jgi:hypothetical protein